MCSNLINVTVPDNVPNLYFALTLDTTAEGRAFSNFLARVNKDEAYALTEASNTAPDERVGLMMFRSQIASYNIMKSKKLVRNCYSHIVLVQNKCLRHYINQQQDNFLNVQCTT